MKTQFTLRTIMVLFLQRLGALVAFLASFMVAAKILPVAKTLAEAMPPSGILSLPAALLVTGAVNALILVWAGRRSRFKGAAM